MFRKIFEVIIAENVTLLMKTISLLTQEMQNTHNKTTKASRIKIKKTKPSYNQIAEISDKEKKNSRPAIGKTWYV